MSIAQHNFSSAFEVRRALNAVAAGTSSQDGITIDMRGYQGVAFIASFGALTASQTTSIKVQQSDNSSTDFSDLEGSSSGNMADADSNKDLLVEVYRPTKRYVRCVVVRGVANAVINGVTAILFRGETGPPALGSLARAAKALNSPAEGTA